MIAYFVFFTTGLTLGLILAYLYGEVRERRVVRVIAALRKVEVPQWRYAPAIAQETKLRTRAVYDVIAGLEVAGIVEKSKDPNPWPGQKDLHIYRLKKLT